MGVLYKAVSYAQQLHRQMLKPGDIAIDATAGNGHDTEYLARLVGPTGHVYAFDIQRQALAKTQQRLEQAVLRDRVTLCHAGHETMRDWVQRGPVRTVMFNLGYLPGADHDLITKANTTVEAVQQAAGLLCPGGLITVVIYPGHAGGQEERIAVEAAVAGFPQRSFTVARYEIVNQVNNPPLVVAIEKLHKVGEKNENLTSSET